MEYFRLFYIRKQYIDIISSNSLYLNTELVFLKMEIH